MSSGPKQRRERLVVIGNGMAGMRTVEELLKQAPDRYDITVFGDESHGNYNRILLSPLLSGEKTAEQIMIHDRDWYREQGVRLFAGDPVTQIRRWRREVASNAGRVVPYDRLLLATGSLPFIPPIPGTDLAGVVSFRTIQDVDTMAAAARKFRHAVVIGGGLRGLEAANGLLRRGMKVTVVHLANHLMERQLDPTAAALLQQSLEARGMRFYLGAMTTELFGSKRVGGIALKDGTEITADLVVFAAGVRPNIELAKACGLQCDRGVLVDDTLQSFDPRVYAVGECVQHRKATYGLVAPLWDQARVCANHLAEIGVSRYGGSELSTQLKVTGVKLFSAGDFASGESREDLVYSDPARGVYKRLVLQGNRLAGAVLFGDTDDGGWYFDLIRKNRDIGALRELLAFGQAVAEPEAA